jgi:hypothetical protein
MVTAQRLRLLLIPSPQSFDITPDRVMKVRRRYAIEAFNAGTLS